MINDLKKLSLFVTLRPCNGLTDGPQQIIKNLVDEGCFKNMAFFFAGNLIGFADYKKNHARECRSSVIYDVEAD